MVRKTQLEWNIMWSDSVLTNFHPIWSNGDPKRINSLIYLSPLLAHWCHQRYFSRKNKSLDMLTGICLQKSDPVIRKKASKNCVEPSTNHNTNANSCCASWYLLVEFSGHCTTFHTNLQAWSLVKSSLHAKFCFIWEMTPFWQNPKSKRVPEN